MFYIFCYFCFSALLTFVPPFTGVIYVVLWAYHIHTTRKCSKTGEDCHVLLYHPVLVLFMLHTSIPPCTGVIYVVLWAHHIHTPRKCSKTGEDYYVFSYHPVLVLFMFYTFVPPCTDVTYVKNSKHQFNIIETKPITVRGVTYTSYLRNSAVEIL